ncbi:lytic transglycosylase domain-containing protein [Pararhizobium sp. LjRoot255]|uniref:lytic transglycosylase domain-containing protein n=1 Tax=Pararhizobium sp. LjRoot255 TaxID=3342298 RepID=UPI003ECE9431
MKRISILAALPLLVFPFENAYAFDNKHFSGEKSHTFDTQTLILDKGSSRSTEDFVLEPSGTVVKARHAQGMNTSWSYSRPAAALDVTREPLRDEINSSRKMNMVYSHTADRPSLETECGASSMKPGEIEDLVGITAEAYGVDPAFAKAIAWAESRFDQTRNSPKGARGPMQLMPDTALSLGVRDLCDPASNIDGGIRHLKALIDEFRNPLVTAAAYNAGSKAVYDNGGIPPYGETIRYVAAVINRQLGLKPRPLEPGSRAAITANKESDGQASSVIGGRGSRFVNGVMHF